MKEYETSYQGCCIKTWTDEADGEIIIWVDQPTWWGFGPAQMGFWKRGFDSHTAAVKFAKEGIDAGDKWKPIKRLTRTK